MEVISWKNAGTPGRATQPRWFRRGRSARRPRAPDQAAVSRQSAHPRCRTGRRRRWKGRPVPGRAGTVRQADARHHRRRGHGDDAGELGPREHRPQDPGRRAQRKDAAVDEVIEADPIADDGPNSAGVAPSSGGTSSRADVERLPSRCQSRSTAQIRRNCRRRVSPWSAAARPAAPGPGSRCATSRPQPGGASPGGRQVHPLTRGRIVGPPSGAGPTAAPPASGQAAGRRPRPRRRCHEDRRSG